MWVDSLAPSHHIAFLAQPQAPEMKAFLFCAAAGLQGACRRPVYLCNNVIRRVCRYTTYPLHLPIFHRIPFSPLFPSASLPFFLASTFHHHQPFYFFFFWASSLSKSFQWPLLTLEFVWCGLSMKREAEKLKVYCFKGYISMTAVFEVNFPCLYLKEIVELGLCEIFYTSVKSTCTISQETLWCCRHMQTFYCLCTALTC